MAHWASWFAMDNLIWLGVRDLVAEFRRDVLQLPDYRESDMGAQVNELKLKLNLN